MSKKKPPGGRRRPDVQVMDIQAKVELLLLYGATGAEIKSALRQNGAEVSERSIDDYSRRIRDVWVAEEASARTTARQRQLARLYRQVRTLQTENKHDEVHKREKLIAKIEGNLAPVQVEVKKSSWDDLTPEQLDFMAKNGGKLPPGVTAEQLRTRG